MNTLWALVLLTATMWCIAAQGTWYVVPWIGLATIAMLELVRGQS